MELILKYYRQHEKIFKPVWPMLLATVLCFALISARVIKLDSIRYGFLLWNLFLAWIPVFFASLLYFQHYPKGYLAMPRKIVSIRSKLTCLLLFGLWLLFFPNSPYIISDLMHLTFASAKYAWFDSVLIFCFAMTGLQVGLFSLLLIEKVCKQMFSKFLAWLVVMGSILLTGLGIYMGRILRFNSWEIFTEPISLFWGTLHHLNMQAFYMTLLYASLIGAVYLMFRSGRNE